MTRSGLWLAARAGRGPCAGCAAPPRGHGDYPVQRLAIDERLEGDALRRCRAVLSVQ